MTFQIDTSYKRVVVCSNLNALYDEAANYGLTGLEAWWFPVYDQGTYMAAYVLPPGEVVWCATPGVVVPDKWKAGLTALFNAQKTFADALDQRTDEIAWRKDMVNKI